MKGSMTLPEGMTSQTGNILGDVDRSPADVIGKWRHEVVQQVLGHDAEETIW